MDLDINELLNFSPLMKTFTFNAWVVAGFTPITRGSKLDYYINRPQGMKGYIINLTLRGQARAKLVYALDIEQPFFLELVLGVQQALFTLGVGWRNAPVKSGKKHHAQTISGLQHR